MSFDVGEACLRNTYIAVGALPSLAACLPHIPAEASSVTCRQTGLAAFKPHPDERGGQR